MSLAGLKWTWSFMWVDSWLSHCGASRLMSPDAWFFFLFLETLALAAVVDTFWSSFDWYYTLAWALRGLVALECRGSSRPACLSEAWSKKEQSEVRINELDGAIEMSKGPQEPVSAGQAALPAPAPAAVPVQARYPSQNRFLTQGAGMDGCWLCVPAHLASFAVSLQGIWKRAACVGAPTSQVVWVRIPACCMLLNKMKATLGSFPQAVCVRFALRPSATATQRVDLGELDEYRPT